VRRGSSSGSTGATLQEALSAAPLKLIFSVDNPFKGMDFFEIAGGGLEVRN
jgi:hypothetical protein